MNAKTRVTHIASDDLWGGAESQLFGLLRCLHDRGNIDSSVITLNAGLLTRRLGEVGVGCHVVDESERNSFQLWWLLRRQIEETRPHVVHCHGYKQNILGSIACVGLDTRCVRTQHGDWEIPGRWLSKGSVYRALDWFVSRFLQDRVIAVSRSLAAMLEARVPHKRIVVIENGVDTEALVSVKSDRTRGDDFVIAFVGRLASVKRIDLFLEAAAILKKHAESPVSFRVFGEGTLQGQAVALAKQLGIADSVHFCGFVPDLPQQLVDADLLLMTSDHEGLPMVLLEALYLQVPVVAPAVGGIPDVLSADYGALVREQSPQAYAEAAIHCMQAGSALTESMKLAPGFIERCHSASRQAEAYEQFYGRLTSRSVKPQRP